MVNPDGMKLLVWGKERMEEEKRGFQKGREVRVKKQQWRTGRKSTLPSSLMSCSRRHIS